MYIGAAPVVPLPFSCACASVVQSKSVQHHCTPVSLCFRAWPWSSMCWQHYYTAVLAEGDMPELPMYFTVIQRCQVFTYVCPVTTSHNTAETHQKVRRRKRHRRQKREAREGEVEGETVSAADEAASPTEGCPSLLHRSHTSSAFFPSSLR